MALLILDGLKKHYAAQEVLSGADLQVDPGERVGIVGRNGAGKTTLLRIIEGLEAPDYGSASLRKGARLGHVPQRPEFEVGVTVRAYVEGGLAAVQAAVAELEQVGEGMGAAAGDELEKLMKRHDELSERIDVLGGWETGRRVETVLSGIGLPEALWEREARTLSGGEKSRTALARELVAGHDLLLLDEPTNHLDLAGIEWIEAWIQELKGSVVIVSHDRRLLDNAVHAIVELERGKLVRYPGNYSRYVALKAERFDADLRAWEQQQELVRKEEAFIKKHMGSQRTNEAKGRQKKLRNVERLERPYHDVRRPVIRPPQAQRSGELVLDATGLRGGHGANVLFEGVDLRVGRGQRVGIVGPNGAGKTTMLEILAGKLAPLAGKVERGHRCVCGYYDQETSQLFGDGTVLSEVRRGRPQMTDLEARSQLARFLFRGDEVEKPVTALSGGERARLALARLVLEEPTWLAMDEPTNHLDLAGRTALEEMLGEYQGAIVTVSHDRAFLDGLCNRIVEIDAGELREFEGNYSAYRAVKQTELEAARSETERKAVERKAREREAAARVEVQKARVEKAGGPSKRREKRPPNPYKVEKLEARIMALEEEREGLNAALASEEVWRDADRMREIQFRLAELERDLEDANAEWESFA